MSTSDRTPTDRKPFSGHIRTITERTAHDGELDSSRDTHSETGLAETAEPKIVRNKAKGFRGRLPDSVRGSEVRKVRRRGYTGYAGGVPMSRVGFKSVAFESELEQDFLIVTDAFEEDIVAVTAQPMTIDLGGYEGLWTPDYAITRSDEIGELVEIKPLQRARPEDPVAAADMARRVQACRVAAEALGFKYRFVTEDEIRVQPLLANAYLVHRHSGPFVDRALITAAIIALTALPSDPTIRDLAEAVENLPRALETAIRLDRLGHIRLDRRVHFSLDTRICVITSARGAL